MITDQLCVFTDTEAVRAAATSRSVRVMPFLGKGEPGPIVSVCVTEAYPAAAGMKITVEESEDGSAFTALVSHDVPKACLTRIGAFHFQLPASLRAEHVRLSYAVTGTPATGKIWAGITRDQLDGYEAGQYIDAGKVVK